MKRNEGLTNPEAASQTERCEAGGVGARLDA